MNCANGIGHGPVTLIYKGQGWCSACRPEVEDAITKQCRLEMQDAVREVLVEDATYDSSHELVVDLGVRRLPPTVSLSLACGCLAFAVLIVVAVMVS